MLLINPTFRGAQRKELVVSTIDLYSWFLEDNNGFKVFGNRGLKILKLFKWLEFSLKVKRYWAWLSPPIWCLISSRYLFAKSCNKVPNFENPASSLFLQLFLQTMSCPSIIYIIIAILGLREPLSQNVSFVICSTSILLIARKMGRRPKQWWRWTCAMPLVTKSEIHEECLKEWTFVTKMMYQHQGLWLRCNMVPNFHLFPIQIQSQLADLNYKPMNQGSKARLAQYNSILKMSWKRRNPSVDHIARLTPNQCQYCK